VTEEQTVASLGPDAENGGAQDARPSSGATVEQIAPRPTGNEQSSIEFPYNDLASAEGVVRAVFQNAGDSCSLDQLAAYMQLSMTSGAFRLRVSNARIFVLTENERGEVRLTPLAKRLCDPSQEAQARAEAFLTVPLYRRVFDRYKGYTLPPPAGLEKFMGEVGVSSKQTDKARQAFMRSAKQAGFFAQGEDRLVQPAFRQGPGTAPLDPQDVPKGDPKGGGGEPPDDIHPAILGILKILPPPGAEWPVRQRVKWLSGLNNVLDLIYEGDDGDIDVVVRSAERSSHH
jgi:hypothetical protein